jgi:hypothetical protein
MTALLETMPAATGVTPAPAPRHKVVIVCSDRSHIGKTLLARLYTDYLYLTGRKVLAFDVGGAKPDLADYYHHGAQHADFTKTRGQMTLFDSILNKPDRDYVIDLASRHLKKFFKIVRDIGFKDAANAKQLELVVLFVTEPYAGALTAARSVHDNRFADRFIPVRNEALPPPDEDARIADDYYNLAAGGDLIVPRLARDALVTAETAGFTFQNLVEDKTPELDSATRLALLDFLVPVYRQIESLQFRLDLADLRRAGFL